MIRNPLYTSLRRSIAPAVAISALLVSPVWAQQSAAADRATQQSSTRQRPPHDDQQQSADASKDSSEAVRQLAVFKLEHRQPAEMEQVIRMAEHVAASDQANENQSAAPRQIVIIPGGRAIPLTPVSDDHRLLTATDTNQDLLFVRGTAEQLDRARTLVKALDVDDVDFSRVDYGDLRLLPVPKTVAATLNQLGLQPEAITSDTLHVLVFHDGDADGQRVQQAERIVNELRAGSATDDHATDKAGAIR